MSLKGSVMLKKRSMPVLSLMSSPRLSLAGRRWFRRSASRPGKRHLHYETLEDRTLLTVTIIDETFKTFDFTTTGGTYSGSAHTGYPPPYQTASYSGTANIVSGEFAYTSRTYGEGTGIVTGSGSWSNHDYGGSYTFSGAGSGTDDDGTLSGTGSG